MTLDLKVSLERAAEDCTIRNGYLKQYEAVAGLCFCRACYKVKPELQAEGQAPIVSSYGFVPPDVDTEAAATICALAAGASRYGCAGSGSFGHIMGLQEYSGVS